MASTVAGLKGNPAATRMRNDKLKAKRARSWAAGERRKADHRATNGAQHTINVGAIREQSALIESLGVSTVKKRPSKVLRNLRRAIERDLATITN